MLFSDEKVSLAFHGFGQECCTCRRLNLEHINEVTPARRPAGAGLRGPVKKKSRPFAEGATRGRRRRGHIHRFFCRSLENSRCTYRHRCALIFLRRNRYLLGQTDQYIREIGHKIQEQREQGEAERAQEEAAGSSTAAAAAGASSTPAADERCVMGVVDVR